MSVKTLTIRDEVYRLLLGMKKEGESFSDAILRIIKTKSSVSEFFGVLKESRALKEIEKEIMEERKKSRFRDVFS